MIEIISKDGLHIKFTDQEANYSNMFVSMFYSDGESKENVNETLPLDYISSELLQKLKLLLNYLTSYKINERVLKKVHSYSDLNISIINLLTINNNFTIKQLFKFIDVCNYLDIPILIEILKMKILSMIENKEDKEVAEIFGVDESILKTNEEIENYIQENYIDEVINHYNLDYNYFNKKEKEAIEILKNFLLD